MKCPFCELDKPYVRAGALCPHCGSLIPAPPVVEPEPEAEPEAANDTEIPADLPFDEPETDQDVEASDPAEGLLPPDEFPTDADPDESG